MCYTVSFLFIRVSFCCSGYINPFLSREADPHQLIINDRHASVVLLDTCGHLAKCDQPVIFHLSVKVHPDITINKSLLQFRGLYSTYAESNKGVSATLFTVHISYIPSSCLMGLLLSVQDVSMSMQIQSHYITSM